jgi:Cd2+/Zn2+-exporting ATPase
MTRIDEEMEDLEENKLEWLLLAVTLGLSLVVSVILDWFVQGIPLDFMIPIFNEPATISNIIYYVSVVVAGSYIGFLGIKELIMEKKFSVEFLMAVAAFGALYLDLLFEASTVLFLYSLSEYFEDYIEDRARKTVEKLSEFMPDKATVLLEGLEKSLDLNEIQPRMTMVIRPGERIALDGIVVGGSSTVDQSLVTGESIPTVKRVGDKTFAGTLNLGGVLQVEVSKGPEDTLVSRIVKLVINSRKRKASIEKLVDRFSRIYVPIIILLAVSTVVFGPSIVGGTFDTWLYRALILLVLSCPSAFVVSVPATIFTAVTIAARKGVIIKGGVYVEKLNKVKAVVFDKTGTLTFGTPVVQDVKTVEELDPKLLMYAAALEQFSNHPLADAIVNKAKEQNLAYDKLKVEDVEEIMGRGIIGRVDNLEVIVGNMDLLLEYGCNCEKIIKFYEEEKHTAICISIEKIGEASVCLMDTVRSDSIQTIESLKEMGIYTAILTGDKKEIAEEVAKDLGVDEVYSELYPEDKLKVLSKIRKKHGPTAMVGDGVNDAPALAASDAGIAMGGGGVDIALESSDIVLVKDELIQIPYLLKLSKETMNIAKQNIVASLGIKIVLGILGLMGLIPLWFTVASGDDGVTLLLLLNTLRLTKLKS